MEVIPLESIENVLHTFDLAADQWKTGNWVFRGQSDASWELKPSAWRETFSIEKIKLDLPSPAFPFSPSLDQEKCLKIFRQRYIEDFLIDQFNKEANRTGLKVNDADLNGEISMRVWPFNDGPASSISFNIQSYALAQHHHIPTRLLDWSTNPRVALYFACKNLQLKKPIPHESPKLVAVFCLEYKEYGPLKLHKNFPHHRFEYLYKQGGCFIEIPHPYPYFYTHGIWPSIEQLGPTNSFTLKKYEIPSFLCEEILERLQACGIMEHTLMPTHDNVGKRISELYY